MCGICGIAFTDTAQSVEENILRGMTGTLVHRGPDSGGLYRAPGVGLGIRRLSIIDVEHGDQPLYSEDRSLALVCNGEIYNYVELRKELERKGHIFDTGSDAEVIIHLYEELGPDCVEHLRGMFAFALWDAPRHRLFLARDRLGIKPLYYQLCRGDLVFGSEAKAILRAGRTVPDLDPAAIYDLLTFGYALGPKTFFAGILRLMPGHRLLYRGGEAYVDCYWQASFPGRSEASQRLSTEDWAEGLRAKLEETVRIHLRSDVPLGTWLSPGVDSSAIAGLMTKITGRSVPAFFYRVRGT